MPFLLRRRPRARPFNRNALVNRPLSTYLGHSSIQITLDRYGHLMPGNEDEAVALVDAYLRRATASS